jgi:hypothetical protein
MTLASEINKKLDEILRHKKDLEQVNRDYKDPNFVLEDANTGEKVTKEMVLNKAKEIYKEIEDDLNKLTNNGKNARDIFTNEYYINNMMEDKIIAEEIKLDKMEECLAEQHNPENN